MSHHIISHLWMYMSHDIPNRDTIFRSICHTTDNWDTIFRGRCHTTDKIMIQSLEIYVIRQTIGTRSSEVDVTRYIQL